MLCKWQPGYKKKQLSDDLAWGLLDVLYFRDMKTLLFLNAGVWQHCPLACRPCSGMASQLFSIKKILRRKENVTHPNRQMATCSRNETTLLACSGWPNPPRVETTPMQLSSHMTFLLLLLFWLHSLLLLTTLCNSFQSHWMIRSLCFCN